MPTPPPDRVRAYKKEDAGTGGKAANSRPYPVVIDPTEDGLDCAGVYFQQSNSADATTAIWREGGQLHFKDTTVGSGLSFTLADLARVALNSDSEHGNRGGGALHATATTSVNGFMSSADKILSDDLRARFWINTYSVNASTPATLTKAGGAALNTQESYRVQLNTGGTGTRTGALYLVYYNGTAWVTRLVSRSGGTSNHPILQVNGTTGAVEVLTSHASGYTVKVVGETFNSSGGAPEFNLWGADSHWSRDGTLLSYVDGHVRLSTNFQLQFGTDISLYRGGADILKTDDALEVGGASIKVGANVVWHGGNLAFGGSGAQWGTSSNMARADHNHDATYLKLSGGQMTGRLVLGTHANNIGLNLPTTGAAPTLVTGRDAGDAVWDKVNDKLYIYSGNTGGYIEIGAGGGGPPLATTNPLDVTVAAAAVGTSTSAARADHKHNISVGTPVAIGTANSGGTATSLARSDHVHNHGNLAGGSLHAVATIALAGFMSAADKLKLDGLTGIAVFPVKDSGGNTRIDGPASNGTSTYTSTGTGSTTHHIFDGPSGILGILAEFKTGGVRRAIISKAGGIECNSAWFGSGGVTVQSGGNIDLQGGGQYLINGVPIGGGGGGGKSPQTIFTINPGGLEAMESLGFKPGLPNDGEVFLGDTYVYHCMANLSGNPGYGRLSLVLYTGAGNMKMRVEASGDGGTSWYSLGKYGPLDLELDPYGVDSEYANRAGLGELLQTGWEPLNDDFISGALGDPADLWIRLVFEAKDKSNPIDGLGLIKFEVRYDSP